MVGEFKANRAFELLKLDINNIYKTHFIYLSACCIKRAIQVLKRRIHLSRSDFDVEVIPLVRDLEDFGPSKPVDAQSVSVDEEAR